MSDVIKIEQRLQDLPQFFILPADEAIALGTPIVLGMLSRQLIFGVFLGIGLFVLWKRVKSGGGIPRVLALMYWILPKEISPFRSLPDSAVADWRA